MKNELQFMSWYDAGEYFKENDVVIMPVGSIEQHGPHNPLGTDHLVAEGIAIAVGKKTNTTVLPGIPVGVAVHHRQFPGVLWVSPHTFKKYVKEVALAIASHGAKKIVVVNGHGGNNNTLLLVAQELRREHDIFMVITSWFIRGKAQGAAIAEGGHGGKIETALNMYFHPGSVNKERLVKADKQKEKLGELEMQGFQRLPLGIVAMDTIDLTDQGLMGPAGATTSAEGASSEVGKKFVEPYIDELSQFVEQLKEIDVKSLLSKPHK
jgi:creatinine amidohydrolase